MSFDPRALPKKNLVLIGGRGCGKSSVSRRIIRKKKRFMLWSLDDLIRYEAEGRSIPEIVEAEGWHAFREREWAVVDKVCRFDRAALIDAGGGVVVELDDDGNEVFSERKVTRLRENGIVIYIQRDTDYLVGRISGDKNRPSLSDSQGFREIMARRDPWYRRASDHVLEATDLSKSEIVDAVLKRYHASEN